MLKEDSIEFQNFIMKPFLQDLEEQKKTTPFDLVFLTGDVVDKGAASFLDRKNWATAFIKELVDPLLKVLNLSKENLFIVPGNHDIWRDRDSKISELGMRQYLNSIESVNEHFDNDSFEGAARTEPFRRFQHEYYKDLTDKRFGKYNALFKKDIAGMKTGIGCLNTAWRSYSDETDRLGLILGERQIVEAKDYFQDCNITIALMHHPLDWLADFDRRCIEPILESTFKLVFCGHQHTATSWVKTDIYNGIFISVAPANWIYGVHSFDINYSNGYSIIDYDPFTNSVTVINRRYSLKKLKYVPNNELGDDQGIARFHLPSSKEMLKWQYESELAENIKNIHFDEFNEHLLTYNTDTKAPQDIESIFVFPRIVEKVELKGEKKKSDKEAQIDIESICATDENLLIFGVKEAGKTLLLDDFVIYLIKNIKKIRRTPVLLDFKRIGSGRIETAIARFLGISITTVKELLTEHDIVLLLDNVTFSIYDTKNHTSLVNFSKEYPKCKIIACAIQAVEGSIPTEVYDFPFFAKMKKLHIKAFGATETRQLIKRWFSAHIQPDIDRKVEKLLETLLQLNLPRTPLAISMFLWILEQQESYEPINNATMLENFIEKLFSKHAKREIYADRFDFKNKVRLLSEIAHQMLVVDDTDYRMTSRSLIDFIDDHLKSNKFDMVQASKVLEHFVTHGILMEEQDGETVYMRYRFSCFMHYFLMKKMEFDDEFKTKVLKPNTMLMFPEEIELYTGTKRDAVDVLNIVVERMEAVYSQTIAEISKLPTTFDQIFECSDSIVQAADDSFLKKLGETQKPTQSELDSIHDEALEKIQFEKGIKKKSMPINKKKEMELLWTLAAQVLRNTEETKIPDLKYRTYVSVLKCSMAHAFIWKVYIDKFILENEGKPDIIIDDELKIQRDVLPLIHELWLRMLLGTQKLSAVMLEKIKTDSKETRVSDYERFISVFLYSDIRGKDAFKILGEFVKSVRNPKLVDMTLFKLVSYYFLRSKNKDHDIIYENLIGDLIVNARDLNNQKKGEVIKHFRESRASEGSKKTII